MLKPHVLTLLMTVLFAAGPAIAEDENERNKRFSEQYKENIEKNREAQNKPHPAHEMGKGNVYGDKNKPCKDKSKSSKSNKGLSQEYKDNLESNRENEGVPHPAHEMGEGDTFDKKE